MSTEYIERGALIAFVRGVRRRLPKDSKDFFTRDEMLLNFQQYVELQPAADVEPVVHAQWEWKAPYIVCSACNRHSINRYRSKRCQHCGAHMDERGDEK
jgi:hypothetical protein